ncbi:glycosyltransferase family 2 protein [Balneola sp. MJW-20]|uniref:glycosyltransferase family 2 protein n=1 Tax=Gracilimonas aurantiaca TaxID=3234185 RepID=UPI003467D9AE
MESESRTYRSPSVTVGIPALNEENHIGKVISIFLSTGYDQLEEILVADGGSTDRTREIVEEWSAKDERVKLLENPDKFQSFGLNRMIASAKGEIFLRADAHCEYEIDYLEKCVENLQRPGVKNAGGAALFLAENLVQAGTAIAIKSVLGNGGAKHYNPDYEGYSDTVPMGCFWTKDLRKLKGFTESNHTNEDAEINYRIQKELNGKIYISPEIKLWYYPRKSFGSLFKQYFRYGRGRYLTGHMHEGRIPFRSKAPFIFIGIMLIFLLMDQLFLNRLLGSHYILGAAIFILLFESVRMSFKEKDYFDEKIWRNEPKKPPSSVVLASSSFIAFLIMHLAHFTGYGYQLIKNKVFRKQGW